MEGTRVLDFGIWRPVPYATALLADMGAHVTKVEPPGGDPMRAFPELFDGLNARKHCVTLDLKTDEGRARALALAAGADVVTEGFRAGVADRLGIGYDEVAAVNRGVVYCSIRDDVAGHDVNYQAAAGIVALQPGGPATPKVPWADLVGGLYAAFRIAAAVTTPRAERESLHLEVAMTDVLAAWARTCRPAAVADLDRPLDSVPGYGVFATRDGHVALGVIAEDHLWAATCRALGLAGLATLGFADRLARTDELQRRLAGALAPLTRDAALDALGAAGAPATPVRTLEEL